jgi:hypothetical protein
MSGQVRFVTGEPVVVHDSKDIIDRVIEGPDVCYRTATDANGNTGTGRAFDPDTAEDRAIFNLVEKRSR